VLCRKRLRIKINLVFKETDYMPTNGKICTKIKISFAVKGENTWNVKDGNDQEK